MGRTEEVELILLHSFLCLDGWKILNRCHHFTEGKKHSKQEVGVFPKGTDSYQHCQLPGTELGIVAG